MEKIVPYLWYDKEALEAAKKYVSAFHNSKITEINGLSDTPSGDVQMVDFQLENLEISSISAGPYFFFNESISFMIACENKEEVDRLYTELSQGGRDLMPLGEYPFSKWYVWFQDQYGLNWQLLLVENMEEHKKITPSLLFGGEVCGRAQEALGYYQQVFPGSTVGYVNYYKEDNVDKRAKINYSELNIGDIQFILMDHGAGGDATFNESFSFMILCEDQKEIDYYWDKLSFVPEAQQCGWVKDQFGVSWQIVPVGLGEVLGSGTPEEIKAMTKTFLAMKKIDLETLKQVKNAMK